MGLGTEIAPRFQERHLTNVPRHRIPRTQGRPADGMGEHRSVSLPTVLRDYAKAALVGEWHWASEVPSAYASHSP